MRFTPCTRLRVYCLASLTGLILWSVARAQGTTITADTDGISGFELHRKGLHWWLESVCGPEQTQAGKISVRPLAGAPQSSLLVEACDALANDSPNVVRDDAYVYFFGSSPQSVGA